MPEMDGIEATQASLDPHSHAECGGIIYPEFEASPLYH